MENERVIAETVSVIQSIGTRLQLQSAKLQDHDAPFELVDQNLREAKVVESSQPRREEPFGSADVDDEDGSLSDVSEVKSMVGEFQRQWHDEALGSDLDDRLLGGADLVHPVHVSGQAFIEPRQSSGVAGVHAKLRLVRILSRLTRFRRNTDTGLQGSRWVYRCVWCFYPTTGIWREKCRKCGRKNECNNKDTWEETRLLIGKGLKQDLIARETRKIGQDTSQSPFTVSKGRGIPLKTKRTRKT